MFGTAFILLLLANFIASARFQMTAYEKAERDLMSRIVEDQEKRGRSIITQDAADEFSRFIKILHDTRRMSEFDNVWVSEVDEARSGLYVAARRSSFFFHMALGAAIDEEAAIRAEKTRAEMEQARCMRELIVVLDADTSIDKKAETLMIEERKKVAEAYERAKKEHDIARIKLNGLRYDCARTILVSACRWLGNFKNRVIEAEMFENLTRAAILETREPGASQDEELKYFKEIAADPPRIQREAEMYKAIIPEMTKKLTDTEPKVKMLREIDVSYQRFLRRDDSLTYTANQTASDLKELLQHVK
uniref:Uncharacterized protein n=1 Tax=Plectus sambesii TaxID=2011161 RepID=A0A914WVL1_9BILA